MASPVTSLWMPETVETGAACAGTLMSAPQAINAATAYFNISIPFCSHVLFSALSILRVFGRVRTDTESTYNAPSRTGFGSTVLCRVAKVSLDAQIEFDYASAGLVSLPQCRARQVIDTGPRCTPWKAALGHQGAWRLQAGGSRYEVLIEVCN